MKTFRMIGMALMAVLMCVNLTSCSEDEEKEGEDVPQYELITGGKKLAKIEFTLSDPTNDFIEIWDFTYDSEGKLIEATFTDSYENKTKNRYTWNNSVINVHQVVDYKNSITEDKEYKYPLNLKSGLVQDSGIIYDETRRPKEIANTTIMWEEDRLYKIVTPYKVSENQTHYEFTVYFYPEYGNTCNGYNPFIPFQLIDEEEDFLFIAHPELAGMRNTQMPISFVSNDTQGRYGYMLDNEGYITEFIKVGKNQLASYIYTMTWE